MARRRRRLTERTIQKRAASWLADHYAKRDDVVAVAGPLLEAGVRRGSKLGRGRADALLAALLKDGEVLTVAMEAKSFKLQRAVIPRVGPGAVTHGLAIGALIAMPAAWLTLDAFSWQGVVGGVGAVLVALVYAGVAGGRYIEADVLAQVNRYPGDERWIAVGASQLAALDDLENGDLLSMCARTGVGLLRVAANGRVTLLVEPRRIARPRNLLGEYVRGDRLREELEAGRA